MEFLASEMTHTMLTPVLDGYGLGMNISTTGAPRFGHGGANAGFKALLFAYTGGSRQGVAIKDQWRSGRDLASGNPARCRKGYGWSGILAESPRSAREVESVGQSLAFYGLTSPQLVLPAICIEGHATATRDRVILVGCGASGSRSVLSRGDRRRRVMKHVCKSSTGTLALALASATGLATLCMSCARVCRPSASSTTSPAEATAARLTTALR